MGPFVTPIRIRALRGWTPASPSPFLLVWHWLSLRLEQILAVNISEQKARGGLILPSYSLQVIIADDYSDPFDAKNDLKSKAGKGESAGYMEPYEAQRIMTGKQSY